MAIWKRVQIILHYQKQKRLDLLRYSFYLSLITGQLNAKSCHPLRSYPIQAWNYVIGIVELNARLCTFSESLNTGMQSNWECGTAVD
jgi:hypothetical protein